MDAKDLSVRVPLVSQLDDWWYDGLFYSNGPGDPTMCHATVAGLRWALQREPPIPVFGVCLGNQIMALAVGAKTFSADMHALVMVYPSPWAPGRYVVVNSGVTHREEDDRTNALQNPKLPDWAILQVGGPGAQPPTDECAGRVKACGFFDEQWRLK